MDENGHPHAVGVESGLSAAGGAIYVMTRRQLKKARKRMGVGIGKVEIPLKYRRERGVTAESGPSALRKRVEGP